MLVDLQRVLALTGLEVGRLPASAQDCPICKRFSKVEVRSSEWIYCRVCKVPLDSVQFYSAATKQSLESGIAALKKHGILECSDAEQAKYIAKYSRQRELRDILQRAAAYPVSGSSLAIFDKLAVPLHPDDLKKLAPHAIPLLAVNLKSISISKENKAVLQWWGGYMAMAMPVYRNWAIVGLYLVTQNGGNYLSLDEDDAQAAALPATVRQSDPVAVIVDNPVYALRLAAWSVIQTGEVGPIVCPYGLSDDVGIYRCGKLVYWSPDGDTRWYLRSLKTNAAYAALSGDVAPSCNMQQSFPACGSFKLFLNDVAHFSRSSFETMARHLLLLPLGEARQRMSNIELDTAARAKILAYAHGADSNRLASILQENTVTPTIDWDGTTIAETPDGWVSKGKLICNATLHLDEVRPRSVGSRTMVLGHILHDKKAYIFREDLSEILRDTGAWMRKFVVEQSGKVIYYEPAWSKRFFEIAKRFHAPDPILHGQRFGWTGGVLRMPLFVVDSGGVHPASSPCEGPQLPMPAALTDGEENLFCNRGFCTLYLALMGNLIRTKNGLPGRGILLSNEIVVIRNLSGMLGCECRATVDARTIEEHEKLPLPVFCAPTHLRIPPLFDLRVPRHVVLSTDTATARLLTIDQNWLPLQIGSISDYSGLRSIFLHLQTAWHVSTEASGFYGCIADAVLQARLIPTPSRLKAAATNLDRIVQEHGNDDTSPVFSLLFALIQEGEIHPEQLTSSEIMVRHAEFKAATAHPSVTLPPIAELTRRFRNGRHLTRNSSDAWVFRADTWNIFASLTKSSASSRSE